jgi:GNAT superfamily N-acetyltransferase
VIAVTDQPDEALKSIISMGLADYNEVQSGRRDARPLAVIAGDPVTGETVGGLLGRTSLGLFFINLFYLPERLRGAGLGSRMLRMAEGEAFQRGCRAATVMTINFQAPEFYRRHGWEEFGRIACLPGIERVFLRKTLREETVGAHPASGG